MQQGGEVSDWRLMTHHDTDYRHAHVLFFRDKRLDKETFLSWQTEVRAELARLEQQRLVDRSLQQEMGLEAGQAKARALSKGQGMALG